MNSTDSPPAQVAWRSIAQREDDPRSARLIRFCTPMLIGIAMLIPALSVSAAPASFGLDRTAAEQPSVGADDFDLDAEAIELPASGQFIVDFAMQYYGYPYVWAGNGPGGFDCSGFTQYVILNTLGIDIGHDVAGQTNSGYWVDWGSWQPGDLVFFAGTYRSGISHVGIYIGDGQFIHAENEGTGVTISSVWSDYYSGHYYGAFRLV